jgi:hypothetical protein
MNGFHEAFHTFCNIIREEFRQEKVIEMPSKSKQMCLIVRFIPNGGLM